MEEHIPTATIVRNSVAGLPIDWLIVLGIRAGFLGCSPAWYLLENLVRGFDLNALQAQGVFRLGVFAVALFSGKSNLSALVWTIVLT